MSTSTSNYNLTKPELSDAADFTAMNRNWDIIDDVLISHGNKIYAEADRLTENVDELQALKARVEALEWIDFILVDANSSDAMGEVWVNSDRYNFDGDSGDNQFIMKKYKRIGTMEIINKSPNNDITVVIIADGVEIHNSTVPATSTINYSPFVENARTGSVIIRY